jgi:hypothetical protein
MANLLNISCLKSENPGKTAGTDLLINFSQLNKSGDQLFLIV